jgi:LysR family cys regulon transcriptional activator
MRIEQLGCFVEVVDEGFSMSRAANILNSTQPSVSKQIRVLEADLSVDLLLRRGGRIVGLTEPGSAVLKVARRMVRDAGALHSIGQEFARGNKGLLIIATQHFIARYMLTDCVAEFHRRFPGVHVVMQQGTQRQALDLLQSGNADIGVISKPPNGAVGVVQLKSRLKIAMSLVAARGHPLLSQAALELSHIAKFPLTMLDPTMAGGAHVRHAFEQAGLTPQVVITAGDMDVVKAYVERGLGVVIIPSLCISERRDPDLGAVDASHLIEALPRFIALHPDAYPRTYTYAFIEMVVPEWTRQRVIRRMLQLTKGDTDGSAD